MVKPDKNQDAQSQTPSSGMNRVPIGAVKEEAIQKEILEVGDIKVENPEISSDLSSTSKGQGYKESSSRSEQTDRKKRRRCEDPEVKKEDRKKEIAKEIKILEEKIRKKQEKSTGKISKSKSF